MPDPDGSLRAHFEYGFRSAQSTPLISRSGRILGMFSTHWKMRRELNERELRFLDLLARQAADLIERTQGEAELRQRELELRESDRHKDEFIAVLAHELRNPLVPIRNGIELLKTSRTRPELLESVRPMMERQIAHMVRLIDDLLDVARISAGKIELQRQRVTLGSVITSAVEATRTAIDNARLDLKLEITDADVLLDVDPTRISQVIANILQNATKFTPARRTASAWPPAAARPVASRAGREIGHQHFRHGRRHPSGPVAARLRPVCPVRQPLARPPGRAGHRTGDRPATGGDARRQHRGAQRRRESRQRVRHYAAQRRAPSTRRGSPCVRRNARPPCEGLDVVIVDDNQDAADSMALLVQLEGARHARGLRRRATAWRRREVAA